MEASIQKSKYRNNLLFYTILKNIVQSALTPNKLLDIKITILNNGDIERNNLLNILATKGNKNSKKYENYLTLLNLSNEDNFDVWKELMVLSIELILIKPLLIEEGKIYTAKTFEQDTASIKDKLSIAYDLINLEKPYGQRVVSALLVYEITKNNNQLLLKQTKEKIRELKELIKNVEDKYEVNTNNIFMIIIDESVNQSIISNAGSSYEERVYETLSRITTDIKTGIHDKNIPSVEYDFAFSFEGKKIGISAKRTLRERYKQNFEDVDKLSVDAVFIITLGIDLNEEKLTNILQRHGYFVIVSQELYKTNSYLKNNKRVISSSDFNTSKLKKLFKMYA